MNGDMPQANTIPEQEVTVQAEDTSRLHIDIEKIQSVPEHEGNLQTLIERYGDNPEACPFIRSMGSAGIELVQRLRAVETEPERGPTMRELLEAKKRQAKLSEAVSEEPKIAENVQVPPVKEVVDEIHVTIKNPEAVNETIIHEQMSKSVEAPLAKYNTDVQHQIEPNKILITPSEKTIQKINKPLPKPTVIQQAPEIPVSKADEPEQPSEHLEAVTENNSLPQPKIIDLPPESEIMQSQNIEKQAAVTAEVQSFTPDTDLEIIEEIPMQEAAVNIVPEPQKADIPSTDHVHAEDMPPLETEISQQLEEILDTYIQLSEEAREVQGEQSAVDQLIEAILRTTERSTSVSSESIIQVEEIIEILNHLRDSLRPTLTEMEIRIILQIVLSKKELKDETQISLEILNYMGTHEHKPNAALQMTGGIFKALKDTFEPHVRIGKFALQSILA